jgi:hypothetical protein
MAEPFKKWTVLPHGKLTVLDDKLLTVAGDLPMPFGKFPRRMTVVRLEDGRLVIYSAMALDEPEMQALEKFGTPSYLIIPSELHRMDAKIWKDRYPGLRVIAPKGTRARAERIVAVDDTAPDFHDRTVQFVTIPGTDEHEAALLVETATGTTLVVSDVIWNVHHLPGLGGWIFRMLRLTGPKPRIANVVRLKIKDKRAFRDQLEAWAALKNLNRIVVSHGDIVERDPPGVLRELAHTLAA